jgi:O-antigen ligase
VLCYSEIGIVGLGLFLTIIVETLFQLRRVKKKIAGNPQEVDISLLAHSFMTILLVFLSGHMMTHSVLYSELLWILLALPICLENATRTALENSVKEKSTEQTAGRADGGSGPQPEAV